MPPASWPDVLAAAREVGVVVREEHHGQVTTLHLIRRAHDGRVLSIPVFPATYDAAVSLIHSLD